MRYCKKCVQPNTRIGLRMSDDMICAPCMYFSSFKSIDWESRSLELKKIAQWGKDRNVSGYDCIIGVSGGKDSTRLAMHARDELNLNPLLVSCQSPAEITTEAGLYNFTNLKSLGFDVISLSPNPKVFRELMKRAFYKYGNYAKSTELALYATPARIAIGLNIPLVFFGENNALVYGDVGGSETGNANKVKYNNTLAGGQPTDLIGDGVEIKDVLPYIYPDDNIMEKANLSIVYMGYYIKDFNNQDNADFAIRNGMMVRSDLPENTGTIFNFDGLDDDFIQVNQMLKYYKLGFGKATDEACEAIRLGRMTREEAIDLVSKYDGRCAPKYIKAFCDYLGITESEFWRVVDGFVNRNLFAKCSKTSKWSPKFVVGIDYQENAVLKNYKVSS